MRSMIHSRWQRRSFLAVLGFLSALLFAACSLEQPSSQTPASPVDPNAPQVLKIAVNPNFPPFEMKSADGSLTGFDIDLINAIGSSIGFIVDFDEMNFDDVIRSLYSGKADAAISAITITPDRAERVAFSRPYFKSGLAIAVLKDNSDITSLDSLRGKRIGVQRGTTGETKAESIADTKVALVDAAPKALEELAAGKVDAVINDAPVTSYAIKNGISNLKLIEPLLSEEYYGIATPKDSPNLEKINAGLATIRSNGTYAQIYQKWFATEPPQLPNAPL